MSICKFCGAPIQWTTVGGRPVPNNPAGERHVCLRPTSRVPTRFGGRTVGEQYAPSACGGCDVPPWEVCPCSFR